MRVAFGVRWNRRLAGGKAKKRHTYTHTHTAYVLSRGGGEEGGNRMGKKGVEKEKEPHETKRARFHRSDAQSAATDLPAVCVWLASTAVATERSK